jgi:phosphohistidine swiveling domain-containing protein
VARWLLSGHNPQETFGIPYPLTVDYYDRVVGRRNQTYVVQILAGGTSEMDPSIPLLVTANGRMYTVVNYFTRNLALAFPFDPKSIGVPKGLVETEVRPRLATLLLLGPRFIRAYRRQVSWASREIVPRYKEFLAETYWRLRECDPDQLTDQDLAVIERLFDADTLRIANDFLQSLIITGFTIMSLMKMIGDSVPALLNLMVGQDTSTAQLGRRMWELCQVVEQCGDEVTGLLQRGETDLGKYRSLPAAKPLLEAMERFMRTYGHRAFNYSSEFEATRLADQLDLVLATVAGLLNDPSEPGRDESARQVSLQALQEMNPITRALWRKLLTWGSHLVELREENRDVLDLQAATYGLAARLLSRYHFPEQPSDYLWLYTFEEFLAFGQSHGKVQVAPEEIEQRRADLEQHRRQPAPPELIWYDSETKEWWPVQEAEAEKQALISEGCLQGIGASGGSGPVEGIAVVTNSAQEAAERLLNITGPVVLVTHVTDPVWSSLFRRLTAVVTEMGGAISHAAIVARENGIPAVVGVPEATRRIRDGQRIRVDGAAGTVEVAE